MTLRKRPATPQKTVYFFKLSNFYTVLCPVVNRRNQKHNEISGVFPLLLALVRLLPHNQPTCKLQLTLGLAVDAGGFQSVASVFVKLCNFFTRSVHW